MNKVTSPFQKRKVKRSDTWQKCFISSRSVFNISPSQTFNETDLFTADVKTWIYRKTLSEHCCRASINVIGGSYIVDFTFRPMYPSIHG